MRGLRIALLSPCFWPEVRRGGERFVRELADGLIARGHRPRLITSHLGPPSRTVEDGLPITRHWRPPEGRMRRRRYDDYMTHMPFSYLSLRLGSDDLAHSVYATDGVAAARWSAKTGKPAVFSFLGIPDRDGMIMRRRRTKHTLEAARGARAVVALSRTAQEAFWRWLGIEARLIHPGVNVTFFARDGERSEVPTVFCGADMGEARKRVDMLVEAMRHVRRERPDARLVLSRPRDPAAAASLDGAAAGVELADVDERSELVRAYSEAWVSALPSQHEAFGLVLVEAMACGTPVVATDREGMREVVDRESVGRLFDGDERDLARALLEGFELAEDPATQQACRKRAEEFSTDRCVGEYLELYREVLR